VSANGQPSAFVDLPPPRFHRDVPTEMKNGMGGELPGRISQTVCDLVAGSGVTFEPAGEHELKSVPDRWRLYAAT
jgi:hypothetical protein